MELEDAVRRFYDPDEWSREMEQTISRHVRAQVIRGVAAGAIEAGLPPDMAVVNPAVLEWADRFSAKVAKRVNETTKENLQNSLARVAALYDSGTIREAIDAGATVQEFRDAIQEVLGEETTKYRATMTAVTEFARAEQTGRLDQLRDSGAVRKVWRTNPDCCDFCFEMDGKTVGIDEHFVERGSTVEANGQSLTVDFDDVDVGLLHPWCRCDYAVEWE